MERRRRERINRSLESLKTLLLQRQVRDKTRGGQLFQLGWGGGEKLSFNFWFLSQEATQRRVEKAEILEHTVLFLQSTVAGEKAQTEAGGGDQKHSFQEGFSSCLQRAARFLGPDGKGPRLGAALDASFAARFSRSDSLDSAAVRRRPPARPSSSSLLLRRSSRSILQLLLQRSGHRLCALALSSNRSRGDAPRSPTTPQRPHKESRSSSQSQPVSQSLWRPWSA